MSALATTAVDTVKQQIAALRQAAPDLWTEEDEVLLADMLEGSTDFLEVMATLEERMAEDETLADAIKGRRQQLTEREDRIRDRIERTRQIAFGLMEAAGQSRVMLPGATLSIRNTPPKVVVIDEAGIPDEYWKTTRTLKKADLAEALKAGTDVPGAGLSNGGRSLMVKRS